jgi:hypothetical protein
MIDQDPFAFALLVVYTCYLRAILWTVDMLHRLKSDPLRRPTTAPASERGTPWESSEPSSAF